MRVLHLLSSTGYHGAENMAAELVRQLSISGVENYLGVFRSHEGSNTEILSAVGGLVRDGVVFQCYGRWDWRTVRALRRYLSEQRIDIVHSHKYKTNLYALIATAGLRCGLVSTCHNWLGTSMKMRLYAALDKRILRGFDRVVGVSGEVVNELMRYLPVERVVKIDNGTDVARFDQKLPKPQAKAALGLGARPVLGFVGRLTADKGVSYLLQAVKLLAPHEQMDIMIIGDGDHENALRNEADYLSIGERVHFFGKRNDTPNLYAAMDVFVLPSLKEAFPIVVLEAMASGVPVIASRVGDIPYILGESECGILVEPGDVSGLLAAIQKLLGDQGAAQQMAFAGQQRVRSCFSSVAMARRYRELYVDVREEQREVGESLVKK